MRVFLKSEGDSGLVLVVGNMTWFVAGTEKEKVAWNGSSGGFVE